MKDFRKMLDAAVCAVARTRYFWPDDSYGRLLRLVEKVPEEATTARQGFEALKTRFAELFDTAQAYTSTHKDDSELWTLNPAAVALHELINNDRYQVQSIMGRLSPFEVESILLYFLDEEDENPYDVAEALPYAEHASPAFRNELVRLAITFGPDELSERVRKVSGWKLNNYEELRARSYSLHKDISGTWDTFPTSAVKFFSVDASMMHVLAELCLDKESVCNAALQAATQSDIDNGVVGS